MAKESLENEAKSEFPKLGDSIGEVLGYLVLAGLVKFFLDIDTKDWDNHYLALLLECLKCVVILICGGFFLQIFRVFFYYVKRASKSLDEIKSLRLEVDRLRKEIQEKNMVVNVKQDDSKTELL
jgi:hypothetical protein